MKKIIVLIFMLSFSSYMAMGQSLTVRGTVTSAEDGSTLPGVTVVVKGTSRGVATGIEGNYEIQAERGDILVFSSVGMLSTEIEVGSQATIDVALEPDLLSIEEVVVTGYAVKRKTNVTGSISKVEADDLQKVTAANVEGLLQGQAAGVFVASNSGRPGAGAQISIRGRGSINSSSSPLWVVDGVIMHGVPTLNPNEIENISILKDASATALYGSRGANGVVLVSTKKAKTGVNNISFNARTGLTQLNNGNFDLMDSQQLYDYWGSFANQSSLPSFYDPSLTDVNTDWWDIGSQTAVAHDYNLALTSSTENMKSYLMVGYYNESGAIKTYDFERYNARLNLDYQPAEWLKIQPKFSGYYSKTYSNEAAGYTLNTQLPWDDPYDENGDPVNAKDPNVTWYGRDQNNYLYDAQWNYSKGNTFSLNGNMDFQVRISRDITFESTNNMNFYYYRGMGYTDPRSNSGLQDDGSISNSTAKRITRFTNQLLRYSRNFGDHSINALAAYEYNDYTYESTYAAGKGIAPGREILDVTSEAKSVGGSKNAYAFQSFLFNASYTYTDRYIAQFSFRRDGSTRFGENNRYGNFFTFSGGWNIHNESFFDVAAIDILKLTGSYGSIGNTPNNLYGHLSLYALNNQYNGSPSAFPSQMPNPDMTWEKAFESNIAVELRLYDRFDVELQAYNKNTDDLLSFVPQSTLTGYTGYWANIGSINNKGVEATLGADIFKNSEFNWNLAVNIGLNRNEVTALNEDQAIVSGSKIIEVGEDIDTWYLRKWAGVNPDNGDPQWEVVDETTGEVTLTSDYNSATRQKVGTSTPDFFGGIFSNMSYKGFSLDLNFNFVSGLQIYHAARELFDSDGSYPTFNQMVLADHWSRWEQPGDDATHPLAYYGGNNNSHKPSSRYLEDGSYLRLKNLRFAYTLPVNLLKALNMKEASIFFSGDNLATFTGFSGADPEVGTGGYIGTGFYPVAKKFMFGLNVTF